MEFELGRDARGSVDGFPRWLDGEDRGQTGRWISGTVSAVHAGDVEVHYVNPTSGFGETWVFSAYGFGEDRPGWLRAVAPRSPRCECGSEATLGARGPHSDWCPRSAARVAPSGPSS